MMSHGVYLYSFRKESIMPKSQRTAVCTGAAVGLRTEMLGDSHFWDLDLI